MTVSPRPAPVVRISDPRAPSAPAQTAPPPEPVPPPAEPAGGGRPARSRSALPLVLLLVGLAVGAGASELRHAQRDRAAEALGAGVLDLRLESGLQEFGVQAQTDQKGVSLRREVAVRNVGGRTVRVVDATLVGGAMRGGSTRELPHGEAWKIVLAGPVRCPGGPPQYAPPGSVLRINAQTDAGDRSTELPVPPAVLAELQREAERSCGIVPPEEAVQAEPFDVAIDGDRATVGVGTYVRSSAPVDLLRVETDVPGLEVAVRAGGRPPVFPFRLDSDGTWPRLGDQVSEGSRLQLVVTVGDCDALRTPPASPLARLTLRVGDAPQELTAEVYDPGVVQPLLDSAC